MKINFKKKYGQNFLRDDELLASIVEDAGITKDDVVLEIGAGAGALTKHLNKRAKKVVSFEIDNELTSLLLSLNLDKTTFVFGDIMDYEMQKITEFCGKKYKIVANLPYYITTPILSKFLLAEDKPESITVMVQKEVGDRITAKSGNSEFGYFSVFCQSIADVSMKRFVPKEMFTPIPKIDSCIIHFENIKKETLKEGYINFCKSLFVFKRKTLYNNLSHSESLKNMSKENIINIITEMGLKESVRSEELTISQINELYNKLLQNNIDN